MDWIENALLDDKPKGDVLINSATGYFVAEWEHDRRRWIRKPGGYSLGDIYVTHFAIITEPTDAPQA